MQRLGHGLLAEPAAGMRRVVGEDGEMHRRFLETSQLQLGVDRMLLARIALQRPLVGIAETVDHRLPPLGRVDVHEAPRLAEADRRRMGGDLDHGIDALARDRIAAEAAHVAAP